MAHAGRLLGRRDDVGEEDRCGDDVALGCLVTTGQEFLDLVEEGVGVADEEQVILAGQLDELGSRNVLGQIPTGPDVYEAVSQPVKDKRRHVKGRE